MKTTYLTSILHVLLFTHESGGTQTSEVRKFRGLQCHLGNRGPRLRRCMLSAQPGIAVVEWTVPSLINLTCSKGFSCIQVAQHQVGESDGVEECWNTTIDDRYD